MKKNYFIVVGVALLLCLAGVTAYALNNSKTPDNQAVSSPPAASQTSPKSETPTGEPITIEGVMTCLPWKDTTGVHDMSCAIGLKTDDEKYYALNASDPTTTGGVPTGQRVKVTGTFTAKTTKYTMEGVVQVEALERL